MTFAEELKKWRGDTRQKNACDILGVPLATLKAWEQGVNEPNELAKKEIRWRIAANQQGFTVQEYKARYYHVIKTIATEILNRKSL